MFPILSYFFFFFQAEDGIRDYKVTGVQTCALPISSTWRTSIGSASAAPAVPTTSPGQRRWRSWAISAARRCGASVRLHDTDTVSGPGLPTTFCFPTDADTNKGPILNSGCGCDAINTWAWALPGM